MFTFNPNLSIMFKQGKILNRLPITCIISHQANVGTTLIHLRQVPMHHSQLHAMWISKRLECLKNFQLEKTLRQLIYFGRMGRQCTEKNKKKKKKKTESPT